MPRVLVLDGHSAAALAFTRSLGRAGYWVAVGCNRGLFAPAFLSRYCRQRLEYPVSTQDVAGFVDSVYAFVQSNGIELIVPATDWTTHPISLFRNRFAGCRLALPSHEALDLASDKYRSIELARSVGIAVPGTWLIQSLDALGNLGTLEFPLVVKDRASARWMGNAAVFGSVAYAYSQEDLRTIVEARLHTAGDVLVQTFVGGKGIGFSCLAIDGEVHLPFQWERIRESDPRGSGSSCRKAVALNPEVLEKSGELIRRAGFQGIAMVEYKQDTSGHPVFMEINGRPWGSLQLAVASGIDYPRYVAEWCLNGKLPPRELPYNKITCRRVVGELTHLQNLRRGKPAGWPLPYPSFWGSVPRMAVPWYPGLHYDELADWDLRPGIWEISHWFRKRLGFVRN